MPETPLPEAIVAAVVRDDRLLVIRRGATVPHPGVWALPCGGMKPGESEAEAVAREVREELGLEVTPRRRLWSSLSADGRWWTYWWEATTEQGEVVPDPREVAEARWCTPTEAGDLAAWDTDREFLSSVWPSRRP